MSADDAIQTCSACGFSGPMREYVKHDCYWVLRERAQVAKDCAGSLSGSASLVNARKALLP